MAQGHQMSAETLSLAAEEGVAQVTGCFLYGFVGAPGAGSDVAAAADKREAQGIGQGPDEGPVLGGLPSRAEHVIEVSYSEVATKMLTQMGQEEEEGSGIGAARDGDEDALAAPHDVVGPEDRKSTRLH